MKTSPVKSTLPAQRDAVSVLYCREMPAVDTDNLQSVWQAFHSASPQRLKQSWLLRPDSDFGVGTVRVGWSGSSVLVFAELVGADIHSGARSLNQPTWLLGDAFEIFFQANNERDYVELHVTPNNQRLQLRYRDDWVNRAEKWEQALVTGELFRSLTWIWSETERWFVYAEVPMPAVTTRERSLPGNRWRYSFSRYDYRLGRAEPIISSTSPHAAPDFHRREEWGTMVFA
ncbi:MAG: hypothetical protein QM813_07465 [Verrucomicrobiota bacterium]